MFWHPKGFVIFIVCAISFLCVIRADTFDECEDVDPNTYVISSESCSAYILCDDDDSVLYECDDGQYFDIDSEICDAKENVFCHLDENNEIEGGDGEGEGEGEGEGDEDGNEILPTLATSTASSTTSANVTLATTPVQFMDLLPIVKDTCPTTDDPNQIVYIYGKNSCSDYYVCYHGHPVEMQCTDHLHFNMLTCKCDFPENSNCKIKNQPPSATNKCLPHVTDFFPHPQKCNYFFYCIKGFQTLQECPFYYGWDIEKRTCMHMAHVKCYDNTH